MRLNKPAIALSVLLVLILVDIALSLFLTCPTAGEQPKAFVNDHSNCGPFSGPHLATLGWLFSLDDNPVIAFFTFVLAVSTIALRIATDKAANAANRSARIAEDSLFQLQRAYVNYNGLRYLSHRDDKGSVWWSLHFNWINSGASPARRVRFYVDRYFEETDLPADYPFDVPSERPENFMGPHAKMSSTGWSVTAEDLAAVREGKKFLYFWGRANYRDIFAQTPDRTTKFSFRVMDFRGDPSKVWNDKTNVFELKLYNVPSRHNYAD